MVKVKSEKNCRSNELFSFKAQTTAEYRICLVQLTTGSTKSGTGQGLLCPELSICHVYICPGVG